MEPIVVPVSGPLPVFEPPVEFEPEWLVPADPKFKGGANYVILNLVKRKRYEGETVCFKDRHYDHLRNMKNENAKGHDKYLYRAMRKHGIENFRFYFRRTFKFEGREKLSDIEKIAFNKKFKAAYLHPCETYWIRKLGLMDKRKGYNRKESGKGGAGYIPSVETRAKLRVRMLGNTYKPTKPVTRCKILEDGETHQRVRLTRYNGCSAAARANPEASFSHISDCCVNYKRYHSTGGYLWWFCKDTDVYDEDITVPRVGNVPGTMSQSQAIISKLELANGFLEQWHLSMGKAVRTLSSPDKKFSQGNISACCDGKRKSHQGYQFRRVTTEKREDFGKDGKRIIKSKKRKRN